jgi:hypothetical protein
MQERIKYPRTPHLPYSETIGSDDKRLLNDLQFKDMFIVITEKMDGENTTVYNDGYHARSLDSKHRDYHSWLLSYIPTWQYMLKDGERVCGEYLYAEHSIHYNNLKSYFLGFSFWDKDVCCGWDSTIAKFEQLGITPVPVLYKGYYDKEITIKIAKSVIDRGGEGIVIRNAFSFPMNDFSKNVAKYVRPNHVQTDDHWSQQTIKHNNLFN